MSDHFYATVVGENRINNFDRLPEIAQQIILAKVEQFTEEMARRMGDLMDERLQTKTGRLSSSAIETEVVVENGKVRGSVFIEGVPYAKIQDEGGQTPPHMIFPKNGKVLSFIGSRGDKVHAAFVSHPGGYIEGKHFTKDAYRSMGPEISRGLKRALVEGIRASMRAS